MLLKMCLHYSFRSAYLTDVFNLSQTTISLPAPTTQLNNKNWIQAREKTRAIKSEFLTIFVLIGKQRKHDETTDYTGR